MILTVEQNAQSLKIPKDIYIKILGKAIAQTVQDIKDFESALPMGDFSRIQSISHRWKGDYDNMRIAILSQVAKLMNEESKQGRDKEKVLRLLIDFKSNFVQLQDELNSLVLG